MEKFYLFYLHLFNGKMFTYIKLYNSYRLASKKVQNGLLNGRSIEWGVANNDAD